MRLDPNPVFRRIIVAWHETEIVCYSLIFFMFLVLFFGVVGVFVAKDEPAYTGFIWVPIALVVLPIIMILTNIYRIFSLYSDH